MSDSAPSEGFAAFRRIILGSAQLQGELRGLTDVEEFIERVVLRSAEHGIEVSPDEIHEAMNSERRAWLERWL